MKVSCKSWFQNEHHTSVAKSALRQIMESSLYGTQAHNQIHDYFQKLGSLLS